MDDVPQYVVWLANLPRNTKLYVRDQTKRTKYAFINREIQEHSGIAAALSQFAAVYPPGSQVVALAAIEPVAIHHALLELAEEERQQREAWRFLTSHSLQGQLYYFRVIKVEMLALPLPVELIASQYKKQLFGVVDESWSRHAFASLKLSAAEVNWWRQVHGSLQDPCILLRLPAAILTLVTNGDWTRLAVPDLSKDFTFRAGWDVFAGEPNIRAQFSLLQPSSLRPILAERESDEQRVVDDGAGDANRFMLSSAAGQVNLQDLLRTVAGSLTGCQPCDQLQREHLLRDLLAAAEAVELARDNRMIFERLHLSRLFCQRYNIASLLRFFFISGLLRNDTDLREVIELCISVALPKDVADSALAFLRGLTGSDFRVPSAATISRTRFRVDTAWMILFREQLQKMLNDGGVRLYVQTDATAQAGRQYQITLINIVRAGELDQLHKDRLFAA